MGKSYLSNYSYKYYKDLAIQKNRFQEMLKREKEGWNIDGMFRYYFKKNYNEIKSRLLYSILDYCFPDIETIDGESLSFLVFVINYEWLEIFNLYIVSEELAKEKFLEKLEDSKTTLEKVLETIPKML